MAGVAQFTFVAAVVVGQVVFSQAVVERRGRTGTRGRHGKLELVLVAHVEQVLGRCGAHIARGHALGRTSLAPLIACAAGAFAAGALPTRSFAASAFTTRALAPRATFSATFSATLRGPLVTPASPAPAAPRATATRFALARSFTVRCSLALARRGQRVVEVVQIAEHIVEFR